MTDDNLTIDDQAVIPAIVVDPTDIFPVQIEDEMRDSYIDYAMSVIVSRALPDVRDGLKPVHRRILFGMHELGLYHNKPFKKSARIVGEVMGKFHPHGDTAIYDTLVRMAQDFSLRYCLVHGQGNFGSIDGDPAAAMRYTEAKMRRIAEEMLFDIDKDTVAFSPNFDDSLEEPSVLPSRIPNLLVNGSDGIAVGMATKIPPNNLGEICDALIKLVEEPETTIDELLEIVKGPDFPTGGYIVANSEISEAYKTGRGRVVMRAKTHIETMKSGKEKLIITEIPYQVNKTKLITDIADLVKDKRVEGISDLRDESDRDGMRIVIELKKGENSEVLTNHLFKFTQLQQTFGVNMIALVDNRPRLLNLREMCIEYIKHRRDVIIRRTRFELRKALERLHLLEGLKIALDNIDEVIRIIKGANSVEIARDELIARFDFSVRQAQAILDMKLQKLTSLETEKIMQEYEETKQKVIDLKAILADITLVMNILKEDLLDVKTRYADGRKTQFIADTSDFDIRDLIDEETKVITVSTSGYIKAIPEETYRRQKRGGKGSKGVGLKEEDLVETIFVAKSFDHIVFITNKGKVYSEQVWKLPAGEKVAKGRPLVNLLSLEQDEIVTAILPVPDFTEEGKCIVFVTKEGRIKRSPLIEYRNCVRDKGIIGIRFGTETDEVIRARLSDMKSSVIMGTKLGKAIHFVLEGQVREQGRVSQGVRGIVLDVADEIVGMDVVAENSSLLVVTEKGYGKRTDIEQYRQQSRGGKGIINIKVNPRNGNVAAFRKVEDDDEVIVSTESGKFIRVLAGKISKIGRNTQGVRIIDLAENDRVMGITVIKPEPEDENGIDTNDDPVNGPSFVGEAPDDIEFADNNSEFDKNDVDEGYIDEDDVDDINEDDTEFDD
jgi:DNA gyrase subunit A